MQNLKQLKDLKKNVKPHEILLVVDAMTGQEAVNVANLTLHLSSISSKSCAIAFFI